MQCLAWSYGHSVGMNLFVVVRGSKVTGMLTASAGTSNGLGVNLMSGDNRQRKRDGSFSPSYTLVVDSRTSKKGKIRVSSVPGPASHELISDVGEEIQHQFDAHAWGRWWHICTQY